MGELKAIFKAKCEELDIEYSDERFDLTQSLGQVMSDASEAYIFAGWFGDWCVAAAEGIAKNQIEEARVIGKIYVPDDEYDIQE